MTDLRVNPEALCHAGNEIGRCGETLLGVHQSCHGEVVGAQPGWVGSSAAALTELLDSWAATGATHFGRIGAHSCDMHCAAAEFVFDQQRSAAALTEVPGRLPGAAVSGDGTC